MSFRPWSITIWRCRPPGYGLITRFEPLLLTDRHTLYFFAHPPLVHVYAAGSFLYHGAFSDLAFFDETSRRVRDAGGVRAAEFEPALASIYQRYRERPHVIETRTPNLFLASATVALLGLWAGRISRRWWMGLLAAAAYATNPEVFVRSSYGGYFAIDGLAALLMLLAAEMAAPARLATERSSDRGGCRCGPGRPQADPAAGGEGNHSVDRLAAFP